MNKWQNRFGSFRKHRKVFRVLKEIGIGATVTKKKYMLFAKEIGYVGFIINKNGIHFNPNKINTISELPEPKDLK